MSEISVSVLSLSGLEGDPIGQNQLEQFLYQQCTETIQAAGNMDAFRAQLLLV